MGRTWDDPGVLGVSGGVAMPATTSSRNPSCRNCGGRKRAGPSTKACECEEPDWNDLEYRLKDREAFVTFLQDVMTECYRVLKPGGHMFVWALPRTSHWTALAIENAGFELRDSIYHVFGSGFPKSLNISKAIDKMKGVKREIVGSYRVGGNALTPTSEKGGTYGVNVPNSPPGDLPITKPATPEAEQWDGWGTALKPAVECWWLCRKPIEGTNITQNVLKHGTGAINIDATRVAGAPQIPGSVRSRRRFDDRGDAPDLAPPPPPNPGGRWPSNIVLTHAVGCERIGTRKVNSGGGTTDASSALGIMNDDGWKPSIADRWNYGTETVDAWECVEGCPVKALDEQSGACGGAPGVRHNDDFKSVAKGAETAHPSFGYSDRGGASRFFQTFEPDDPFFYTAKAARSEKNDGLDEDFPSVPSYMVENGSKTSGTPDGKRYDRHTTHKNTHPTVKPISLMRYLVKMVTPKGGLVLDPFAGSGSTLIAAVQEEMHYIGIEREEEYVKIAKARVHVATERAVVDQTERSIFDLMMAGDE